MEGECNGVEGECGGMEGEHVEVEWCIVRRMEQGSNAQDGLRILPKDLIIPGRLEDLTIT